MIKNETTMYYASSASKSKINNQSMIGFAGLTGSVGFAGLTGSVGFAGLTGSVGFAGLSGSVGFAGLKVPPQHAAGRVNVKKG